MAAASALYGRDRRASAVVCRRVAAKAGRGDLNAVAAAAER